MFFYILLLSLLLFTSVDGKQASFLLAIEKSSTTTITTPTHFSNQEVCALIKLAKEDDAKFLGYYEEALLFESPYQHTVTFSRSPYKVSTLWSYDKENYSYVVLEGENETPGNNASEWRSSVDILRSKLEVDLLEIGVGKVLLRVDISKQSTLLSTLPASTLVGYVVPKNHVCQSKDYTSLFRELTELHADPDPFIQSLVNEVNTPDLRAFIEYLTGEAASSPIFTRNSLSVEAVAASKWLQEQFISFGFSASLQTFATGYSDNVVAILPGAENNTDIIVISSHYDSRAASSTSPTQRAPGANDNGSGTTTLLQMAKIIHSSKLNFLRTIHIVCFSGEEQGLLGSQAYARKLVSEGANVVAVINSDMIAYRAPGSAALLGFPQRYTTPTLTELAITASNTYVPAVSTGRNDRCCSDHRSFFEVGYAATDFSDTHGPIVDPMYHNQGDLVNRVGFDFEQLGLNTKAAFATLLILAHPAHP